MSRVSQQRHGIAHSQAALDLPQAPRSSPQASRLERVPKRRARPGPKGLSASLEKEGTKQRKQNTRREGRTREKEELSNSSSSLCWVAGAGSACAGDARDARDAWDTRDARAVPGCRRYCRCRLSASLQDCGQSAESRRECNAKLDRKKQKKHHNITGSKLWENLPGFNACWCMLASDGKGESSC